MWVEFALAVFAGVIVFYLPGYLVARAFSVGRFASLVIAPALSVFFSTVVGIVLEKLGVACSGPSLFGIVLACAVAVFLVGVLVSRGKGLAWQRGSVCNSEKSLKGGLVGWADAFWLRKAAMLYMGVSLVVVLIVFLSAAGDPYSFSRNDDTTVHLSLVRAFLETGTFSTLETSSYLSQGAEGGFYPAAWHVMVSMVASLFGDNVAMVTNAVMTLCLVAVFPLALCLLFARLFGDDKRFVWAGALFAATLSGFPWGFTVFGQLLPNMLSFMLVPMALLLLVETIDEKGFARRAALVLLLCMAILSIAFSQPNGAFTFGIWAVLYGVSRVFYAPDNPSAQLNLHRVGVAVALLAVACVVWAVMYCAPFMQGVVQTNWAATLSPVKGIAAGLSFMFTVREGIQPFVSIVVLAGVVYTIRHRRFLWLSVAYALALLMYFIDVSFDGVFKHIISGFWYTDCYRTGAMAALFAIPLAAMGFACLLELLEGLFARMCGARIREKRAFQAALAVLLVVFAACQFLPLHAKVGENKIYAGLMGIRHEISTRYSWDRGLTSEEDAFIERVMDEIPEGALVINVPSDGSCWSYGVEGLNTYFHRSTNTGGGSDQEAEILRTGLRNVSSSEEVRQLVDDLDAQYVLMLDDLSSDHPTRVNLRYSAKNWEGIELIDENTPGFTLVLSEGDMRLYKIEDQG